MFRLLARADITPTANPKRYDLTLDLKGNAAKLQFLTDSEINAFIRHVLAGFRCPEHV